MREAMDECKHLARCTMNIYNFAMDFMLVRQQMMKRYRNTKFTVVTLLPFSFCTWVKHKQMCFTQMQRHK